MKQKDVWSAGDPGFGSECLLEAVEIGIDTRRGEPIEHGGHSGGGSVLGVEGMNGAQFAGDFDGQTVLDGPPGGREPFFRAARLHSPAPAVPFGGWPESRDELADLVAVELDLAVRQGEDDSRSLDCGGELGLAPFVKVNELRSAGSDGEPGIDECEPCKKQSEGANSLRGSDHFPPPNRPDPCVCPSCA